MNESKSSKRWLKEHFKDIYVKKAQRMGYRSRSAFKILELQEKDKFLKPGMTVLDLGAAPGGWSQVVSQLVGKNGKVIALDILPMEPLAQVEFIQGDFTEPLVFDNLQEKLKNLPVDLVISDMSPNISGDKSIDQPRAMYLAELALDMAIKVLKPGGNFLVKVFQGEGSDAYLKMLKLNFKKVKIRKPAASRSRSSEIYFLGNERILK